MSLPVFFDRVMETSATTGSGTLTLAGAVAGFRAFSSVIGSGTALVNYTITDASDNWEVGSGTYTFSGTTLSRTTILASTNSGSAVSFPGATTVWLDYPASLILPTGFIGVTEVELDFGATPTIAHTFTVVDANITLSHNIMMIQCGETPTSKSQDENEFDNIDCSCVAGTGQFTVYAFSQTGPVVNKFKFNYIFS